MSASEFSLLRGGPLFQISRSIGLAREGRPMAAKIALALMVIVLVPVIVATALRGTLLDGVEVPLVHDYLFGARFLIAMPLLVLAAPNADQRIWRAVHHMRALVLPADRDRFEHSLGRLRAWRDSVWPELVLFALVVASCFIALPVGLHDKVTDWRGDEQGMSAAAQWVAWVGSPVFRFLVGLWLWRMVLWIALLFRFSRMDLALHGAHPDGRGGLSFLSNAQSCFATLIVVGGVLLAGSCIFELQHLGVTLKSLRFLMAGYIVLGVIVLVAPLLLLTPRLLALKQSCLLAYGALGTDCAEEFEQKWLGRARGGAAPILEAGDSSALCDLTGVYSTVSTMSVVPFRRDVVLQAVLAGALPLIPVLLVTMPITDLLKKLISVLM